MSKDAYKNYKEDFLLLLEAGFIAVNAADEDSAVKLFKAAEVLKPESTFPKVGFGYMHLCKLELKQATKIFREVLDKEPDNEMAKTFLGICMTLIPNEATAGEKSLEELTHSNDSSIKKLAGTAIEFAEKFVKKSSSPIQPQPPKQKRS
jgi:hypothetical protein